MKYIKAIADEEEIDGTIEFELTDKQIENLIKKLRIIQDKKSSTRFEVNNVSDLIIKWRK